MSTVHPFSPPTTRTFTLSPGDHGKIARVVEVLVDIIRRAPTPFGVQTLPATTAQFTTHAEVMHLVNMAGLDQLSRLPPGISFDPCPVWPTGTLYSGYSPDCGTTPQDPKASAQIQMARYHQLAGELRHGTTCSPIAKQEIATFVQLLATASAEAARAASSSAMQVYAAWDDARVALWNSLVQGMTSLPPNAPLARDYHEMMNLLHRSGVTQHTVQMPQPQQVAPSTPESTATTEVHHLNEAMELIAQWQDAATLIDRLTVLPGADAKQQAELHAKWDLIFRDKVAKIGKCVIAHADIARGILSYWNLAARSIAMAHKRTLSQAGSGYTKLDHLVDTLDKVDVMISGDNPTQTRVVLPIVFIAEFPEKFFPVS